MSALKLLVGKYMGHEIYPNIYHMVKKEGENSVCMCAFINFIFFVSGGELGMLREAIFKAQLLSDMILDCSRQDLPLLSVSTRCF